MKHSGARITLPLRALALLALLACGATSASGPATDNSGTTTPTITTVPDFYKNFSSAVTVTRSGDNVTLVTTDVPDHKSPYFATTSSQYEAYNGSNSAFSINPNRIASQQMTFRIPVTPTVLSTPSATPLGAIGIALNGVAIFNQYAGPSQPLSGEINSFDQYNGHPQQTGVYHYHVEPLWLTRTAKDALIGVLLDGYPVYGPLENGKTLTSADLDAAHGHFGATKEFPNGIYHYHTTADAPYINGSGFYGAPGTVSN
jgi:hypothetical protein